MGTTSRRRHRVGWAVPTILFVALLTGGCILGRQHPAATQPATALDLRTADPQYWLDKPAVAHVDGGDFDQLWQTWIDTLKDYGFTIDRQDYREGFLTTQPLISKGALEVWKRDVVDVHGIAQSSLSTMRRMVQVRITRKGDGTYKATPEVLVEREALVERRITSAAQYRDIFSIRLADVAEQTEESGQALPAEYWYPVDRDHPLERELAEAVRGRLARD